MDFVPYIKSIYSEDIGSATRSRLGKFPVRADANMIIEGMNFVKDASYTVKFYKSNRLVNGKIPENTEADSTVPATFVSDGKIRVTAPDYSRWVEVEVTPTGETAGVSTNNNGNENGGYNIESGYVAKANDKGLSQANTAGTNFWTDDRYISVWNVGTTFADSTNPIMGTIEKVSLNDIKYLDRKAYGKVTNSSDKLNNNTVYSFWGADDNMVWDNILGKSRAASIMPSANGALSSSPAQLDTCVITVPDDSSDQGQAFVAFLDNTIVNSGTFGPGLLLLRDGQVVQQLGDGSQKSSVELIKEDKMKNQFQNIKIAGIYGTSSDSTKSANSFHVYISYYDAATKCLKYGKIELRPTIDGNQLDLIAQYTCAVDSALNKFVVDGKDSAAVTNNNIVTHPDDDTTDVGQWSDIKVINSDNGPLPIIVYYESTGTSRGNLKFAKGKATVPDGTKSGDNSEWEYKTVKNPDGVRDFGRYVSMEMDASGGFHVVCQDAISGVLYYGYFASISDSPTGGWKKVDATSSVGRWTDIKLANPTKSGLAAEPVVTYMDGSKLDTTYAVKVAYMTDSTNCIWDSETDPAEYAANSQYKMSIVSEALDLEGKTNKLAVGINSSMLAVDFLRGEE